MSQTHDTVIRAIREILTEKGAAIEEIESKHTLTEDLGLDSLDLAVLVVKLEQSLGCDPFRDQAQPLSTLGQFVSAYDQARGEAE